MGTSADKLGTAKIPGLFLRLAIPTVVAQLVNVIYNMVDRIYIGRVPDSELAMSALAVSLPVVTLISAFNSLLGFGGAPIAAMKLGQKDVDGANKILTNSFSVLTIVAIALTIIIQIFQEPILYAFGADITNIELAKGYVGIYSLGTIFVLYAVGLNPYITTQGKSSLGMATVLIGAILNIILDPIFIFVLGMGVQGAAIATIIAQAVSAVWVMLFFFKGNSIMRIKRAYIKPNLKIVGSIVALGVSPFIMTATEGLLQITFNNQLKLYGGTLAVGTMAILSSLFTMLLMTVQGMAQGAQPIMSYNLGAGNMDRVRKAFKLLFVVATSFSVISVSIVVSFPEFFAGIFADSEDALRFAAWAIPPYFSGALVFGVQLSCQQSFLALGEAKRSLLMAITRKIILLIPLIFIMPMLIGNLDIIQTLSEPVADLAQEPSMVFAVLSAESVADFTAAAITGCLFFRFYKTKLKDKV
ncbi:MAG: MATE family efflux transporter [Clostridia bacterium]